LANFVLSPDVNDMPIGLVKLSDECRRIFRGAIDLASKVIQVIHFDMAYEMAPIPLSSWVTRQSSEVKRRIKDVPTAAPERLAIRLEKPHRTQ
jgi:hypothetical protein